MATASSVTFQLDRIGMSMVLHMLWIGNSTNGAVTSVTLPAHIQKTLRGMAIALAITNPGSTAPSDGYSITLTDADGIDVFGGAAGALSSTASEQFAPIFVGNGKRVTDGELTLNVSDNSVVSAVGMVRVYFTN